MCTVVRIAFAVTKEAASASAAQSGKQVVKTDTHDSGPLDQVHNRTQTLADCQVGSGKSLMNTGFWGDHVSHAIVFETDHGLGGFVQACERIPGLGSATFPFESKWQRREPNNERTHFARDLRDHGRRARASPTAQSGTNENQTCLCQCLTDFIGGFLRGIETELGIAASSKAACKGAPQLHFDPLLGAGERLDVGVS